ncbi:hypothetical protein ACQP0C_23530 [Nocardia sp. CA-129566]
MPRLDACSDYLEALAAKADPERFDTESATATKGTDIAARRR